jgi:NADH-ubiquinone oxidoreductase chain 2
MFIGSFILGLKSLNLVSLNTGIGLFGGLFHTTATTNTFHVFIIFISFIVLQLTSFYSRKLYINGNNNLDNKFKINNILTNKMNEQYRIIEYPLIILFIITGAIFLISSSDIVSIFLSIELQSYGLYLLCTLYRNSELSTSAGLTYFLLGGLSSCFILLGTALLYTNSGTTSLESFYIITNLSEVGYNISDLMSLYNNDYINYSLLIMSIGFLFKISAAPFHFWSPDVYDAIPTVVTTFVANIAKVSIFIFLLEIVHFTSNFYSSFNFNWTISLLLSSLLSLIVGTILGLNQTRIKRLLAYSTISHLGFMLLALSINSIESTQAFIFYLMQYSLSNINAFVIIISIGYTLYIYVNQDEIKKDKGEIKDKQEEIKDNINNEKLLDVNNSPLQLLSQLKGYYYINPVIAISFAIVIYSFVGIPPLVGFFGKQMILSSALDKGFIFITFVAILTSVISAVYYLVIVKQIFFYKSDYRINGSLENIKFNNIIINNNKITLSSNLSLVISILTLIILLFIINPQEWLSIANILALLIFK